MATANYKRFDVKHGISVNGLPFVDENRNVVVNDLTVQGVSTIVDTRTITAVDPIISLGVAGKTYTTEDILGGTHIKFPAEAFSDIAVGDSIKYDSGDITGLTAGTTYYVVGKTTDVTSSNYRGVQISTTRGGAAITGLTESVAGGDSFTLNPLRDLDQDLGIEFNYVDGTAKKGFFGYQDTTGHFTFLLNTSYGGSSTESDDGSSLPVFTGTKAGVEVQYVKLNPTNSLSTNQSAIDIDQTWDGVGITFKAIEVDIIDTNSAADSSLLDIAVGGSQKLLLRKDGALALNTGTIEAALTVAGVNEDTTIYAASTWNNAGTAFIGIDLQITETAFAAGSKLLNLDGGANRDFYVDAYGNISSRVEFTGGALQTAIKLDVTDTSSAADSLLLDLQVGSGTKFSVDKDGDVYATGSLTVEGDVTFNSAGGFKDTVTIQTRPNGAGTYEDNTQLQTTYVTLAAGTSTATTINSFASATFVTGKYLVQIKQGADYHVAEVLLIHAGGSVYMTEYAAVYNDTIIGTLDASITGGNVNLTLTPTAAAVAENAQIDVRIIRMTLAD
jgi:hypothetical protein